MLQGSGIRNAAGEPLHSSLPWPVHSGLLNFDEGGALSTCGHLRVRSSEMPCHHPGFTQTP